MKKKLCARELLVLRLVAEGCTDITIAKRHKTTLKAIKCVMLRVRRWYGVHTRTGVVWQALMCGDLQPPQVQP